MTEDQILAEAETIRAARAAANEREGLVARLAQMDTDIRLAEDDLVRANSRRADLQARIDSFAPAAAVAIAPVSSAVAKPPTRTEAP